MKKFDQSKRNEYANHVRKYKVRLSERSAKVWRVRDEII
jgi:hypothetical protein